MIIKPESHSSKKESRNTVVKYGDAGLKNTAGESYLVSDETTKARVAPVQCVDTESENGFDCKSNAFGLRWFDSISAHTANAYAKVKASPNAFEERNREEIKPQELKDGFTPSVERLIRLLASSLRDQGVRN